MDLLKVHIILPNKPTIPETVSLLKYITKFIFCSVSFLVLFLWLLDCNLHALRIFKCVKLKVNKILRGSYMTLKQLHHRNSKVKYMI